MAALHTDFLVVGAGASGAAVTWRLATLGRSVLCIDQGGWFDPDETGPGRPGYEAAKSGTLSADPNQRRSKADYPVDNDASPIGAMIGNGFGGGTNLWAAHAPRYRPGDFTMATDDGVGADWPIRYADLEPYFELNEARIGVAGRLGDPTLPPRRDVPLPLPPLNPAVARIGAAAERLGWHVWPVDLVVGRDAGTGPRCRHPGPCESGCPSRRRASTAEAYLREAEAAGARLHPFTRALRIETDADGRVSRVLCARGGEPVTIHAGTVVLAMNGIGTPRLLLASACEMWPDGLANRSGLVGRNLMLHPYGWASGAFAEPLGGGMAGPTAGMVSLEFFATDRTRGAVRGMKLQVSPGAGPLWPAFTAGGGAAELTRAGLTLRDDAEFQLDHIAGISVCVEDLPDPENRILLSPTLADDDGVPAPRIVYRLSDNSRALIGHGTARSAQLLRAAGAVHVETTPLVGPAGFHLMGTAVMGRDAATSVVDPFGRCHDVPNLFVVDSSVFVTASSLNPTATSQAFALRAADHMASR